jgi:hypothetical protein
MTYSTPALGSSPPVGLRVGAAVWEEVNAHVLRDDNDEHGGVLLCGVASANGSTRLLARRFMLAVDGTDYVPLRSNSFHCSFMAMAAVTRWPSP